MEKSKAAQTASTLQEARAHLTQVAACVDPVFARRLNPRINEELVCEKGMGGGMMKTGKAAGPVMRRWLMADIVTTSMSMILTSPSPVPYCSERKARLR